MKNFRTYKLALSFYKEAKHLRLSGSLRDQYQRALLSIPLNLGEGSAKPTAKERRKFYHISLGSLREVQTILEITEHEKFLQQADILGAHLYKLCKNT